jgi:hypothetical protein
MIGHPAGCRQHHAENEKVSGQDPLDPVEIGTERGHDFGQCDIDNSGVQDSHERSNHDIGQNPPLVGTVRVAE